MDIQTFIYIFQYNDSEDVEKIQKNRIELNRTEK